MRPPAGVECATCRKQKNHRCQAQIYDDGVALCMPCANGDPCVVDRVGAPPALTVEADGIGTWGDTLFESSAPPSPVIHRTPEELGLARVVQEAAVPSPMSDEEFAPKKREAFELANAVWRRERAKPAPNFGVRAYRERTRQLQVNHLDVKVIGGEEVRMSPKAVTGPEIAEPLRPRLKHFPPEDLERRRRDLAERNAARGAETRAKVEPLLGTASDREVAEQVGVGRSRVSQLRKEKGIPAFVAHCSHQRRVKGKSKEEIETIMDEMREAVKKLGGTMTDNALGEQLGVSGSRIGQLRKELGIAASKTPPGRKAEKKTASPTSSKALIKAGQRPVVIENGAHPALDKLAGEGTVRLSMELTRAQACAQFARLSPAQMGAALEAALRSSMQEG